MEEVIKKKKGRKPKIKVEEEEPVVKKKRGRKPKVQTNDVKVPKKRGRKPKLKYDVVDEKKEIVQPIETVILHFPIKQEKLLSLENKPIIPHPYNDNETNDYMNIKKDEKLILDSSIIDNDLNNPNIIDEIQDKRKNELSLEDKSNIIFINLIESNKKKKMPDTTNIHCLWDTESFTGKPYGIPIKKIDNVYHMFGNFCSKECAAAYLFDMNCENDEFWERYSMLNYLYTENETVKPALPRLALKKFGGFKTIEEFRCCNKTYDLIMPPMINILPSLEEVISNNSNNIINISKPSELKLKRNNPLPNFKNSLENCMNLKYV